MTDTASSSYSNTVKPDNHGSDRDHTNGGTPGRTTYGQNYGTTNSTIKSAEDSLAFVTQSMQALTMVDNNLYPNNGSRGQSINHPTISAPSHTFTSLGHGLPTSYWGNNNGMVVSGHQPFGQSALPPNVFSPTAAHYLARGYGHSFENSPMNHGWASTQAGAELPTLITPRRESLSSIENDTPGTPTFPGYHPTMTQAGVAILSRSPSGTYTTSTPSPLHMLAHYGMPMAKIPDGDAISPRLQMLVSREPAIPPAIPAPSSPLKPLDRALENTRGETNVYIRGLMPETSDEMLAQWGLRFGDIKSSKSIIDHNTGRCKGFGFVRYHNYTDAEDCIRGFHHLGYEVSFARESFYSKLKAIADDANTNLYVSNLPKQMNEHELASIFAPRKVCSARILRTNNGIGRGVGFARFENRLDCEQVIRDFNNKTINSHGAEHTIQIRYADTQEQKSLKQTTAAARQFRSDEYEYATRAHRNGWFGPGSPLQQQFNGQENMVPAKNEFKNFLGQTSSFIHRAQNYSDPTGWRPGAHRSPLSVVSPSTSNIRMPSMSVNSTPMAKTRAEVSHEGGVSLPPDTTIPPKPVVVLSPARNTKTPKDD